MSVKEGSTCGWLHSKGSSEQCEDVWRREKSPLGACNLIMTIHSRQVRNDGINAKLCQFSGGMITARNDLNCI